jgi:hypothetical protein
LLLQAVVCEVATVVDRRGKVPDKASRALVHPMEIGKTIMAMGITITRLADKALNGADRLMGIGNLTIVTVMLGKVVVKEMDKTFLRLPRRVNKACRTILKVLVVCDLRHPGEMVVDNLKGAAMARPCSKGMGSLPPPLTGKAQIIMGLHPRHPMTILLNSILIS